MTKESSPTYFYFLKNYPVTSVFIVVALLVAGIVEIIGISALLPLLNAIMGVEQEQTSSSLNDIISTLFNILNVEKSFSAYLIIIIITIFGKAAIMFWAMRSVGYASVNITQDLRTKLIKSLMSARWEFFTSLPIGKSATSIATEAENAGQYFMMVGRTLSSLTQVCAYALIVFMVDWKISLVAIFAGAIGAYCLKFLVVTARTSGVDMAENLKNLMVNLNESLNAVKPLKAMGQERKFITLLEKDIRSVNEAKKKQITSNLLLQAWHEPILITLISAGLFWAYFYSDYPFGELLLIAFLFHRLISQGNLTQSYYQKANNFEGSVSSILAAINDASNKAEENTGSDKVSFRKEINLSNVTLGYDNNIILQNLEAVIPANKLTVIFGPSGVGKSTLIDSILGMLPTLSGEILVDGTPLTNLDQKEWRNNVGYVPQENFLFHNTIFKNITLDDDSISEEDAITALKKARAWDFIDELPDGLYHIVGERGSKLSGGQRQRIALARALVRKPALLILDEATTGLDKENEDIITETLQSLLKDTTIISISHDPKMLDHADHVIKLEKDA
jgi:ATP-binding cassette subfamily C protein